MEAHIKTLIAKLFDVDETYLSLNSSPDEIEKWDSLGHMNIVAAIEEEFEIELSDDEIDAMANIASIINIVEGKIS
jgi:acyl carrier protein